MTWNHEDLEWAERKMDETDWLGLCFVGGFLLGMSLGAVVTYIAFVVL